MRRAGGPRDLRGRGLRGPVSLPGPISPRAAELRPTRRDEFDELVLAVVDRLTDRVGDALAEVEFGTEEVPPPNDLAESSPLSALLPASSVTPTRIVVFRRPIEMRAKTPGERTSLVQAQLVDRVATFLSCDPADLDE